MTLDYRITHFEKEKGKAAMLSPYLQAGHPELNFGTGVYFIGGIEGGITGLSFALVFAILYRI